MEREMQRKMELRRKLCHALAALRLSLLGLRLRLLHHALAAASSSSSSSSSDDDDCFQHDMLPFLQSPSSPHHVASSHNPPFLQLNRQLSPPNSAPSPSQLHAPQPASPPPASPPLLQSNLAQTLPRLQKNHQPSPPPAASVRQLHAPAAASSPPASGAPFLEFLPAEAASLPLLLPCPEPPFVLQHQHLSPAPSAPQVDHAPQATLPRHEPESTHDDLLYTSQQSKREQPQVLVAPDSHQAPMEPLEEQSHDSLHDEAAVDIVVIRDKEGKPIPQHWLYPQWPKELKAGETLHPFGHSQRGQAKKEVCRNFLSPTGCTRKKCRFLHASKQA